MRKAAYFLLHVFIVAIGTWGVFAPTLRSGFALLQTDPGDTILNHYILEHSWKWLTDSNYPATLWSPPCFAPATGTLAYSENLLGAAPLYWLLRCGFNELHSYQLWMIGCSALNYASMAWVLRRLNVTHLFAALGGVAFAFGLPRIAQLGHQQLLPAYFAPLAIYWLWRFIEEPRIERLVCAIAFGFGQMLASIYLGWFLALALAVFLAAQCLVRASRARLKIFLQANASATIVLALIGIAATAGFLLPYFSANRQFHRSYRHEITWMLPRPSSYGSPAPGSVWADVLPAASGPLNHEHHLFPGAALPIVLALVVGIGVMGLRKPILRDSDALVHNNLALTTIAAAAFLTLVSLKIGKISAWQMIYAIVPGAHGIRAITRIFTATYMLAWIGCLMIFCNRFRARPRLAEVMGGVLLAIGLGESIQPNLPSFDPAPFFAEADRLAEQMRGDRLVYVELDSGSPFWVGQLAAMWAGLKADVPVVNGYSGRTPPGYPDEKMIWQRADLRAWLRDRDVRVLAAPRLAAAYPAPPAPPGIPGLDFRPYASVTGAENGTQCPITPTKR